MLGWALLQAAAKPRRGTTPAVSLASALGQVGLTAEQVFIGKVLHNFVLCSIISCLPSGTFSR